jgi:hypothetical protein
MLELFTSWFLSKGVGLLLGALVGGVRDILADRRNAQAQQDVGRLSSERDQARVGEAMQTELADQAGKRVEDDEALKRLGDGTA